MNSTKTPRQARGYLTLVDICKELGIEYNSAHKLLPPPAHKFGRRRWYLPCDLPELRKIVGVM